MIEVQCPQCKTNYRLSQAQLEQSRGKMRCGNCRLAFLVDETAYSSQSAASFFLESSKNESAKADASDNQQQADLTATSRNETINIEETLKATDAPEQAPKQASQETAPEEPAQPKEGGDTSKSDTPDSNQTDWLEQYNQLLDDEAEPSFDPSMLSIVDDNTEFYDTASEQLEGASEQQAIDSTDSLDEAGGTNGKTSQASDTTVSASQNSVTSISRSTENLDALDSVATATEPASNASASTEAVIAKDKFSFSRFSANVVWLVLVCALASLLLLQLHQRQLIDWFNATPVEPVASDAAEQISRVIPLPSKTKVGELELISAKLAEHPTRSTTSLLHIRILNHASFEQALPHLQLTLYDSDGRIISRRSLDPKLYTHNNNTAKSLKSRELKPISIEFLDFPNNTEGYEIRIISPKPRV